ncbi:hypothetical protein IPL85_05580 [Candidatus Saccharibacteria bacterium]|nr:MAG: hypothetical protein IPL85_05580 [Candidatus Saccharibacteria bacterium]
MSALIPNGCKTYNLVCAQDQDGRVLLGRKTRGFGTGQLVMPGGKPTQTSWPVVQFPGFIAHDAARELNEESGVDLAPRDMSYAGALYIGNPVERMVLLFRCAAGRQVPRDSEEVTSWNFYKEIPYDQTPEDYKIWLPSVLAGEQVIAHMANSKNTLLTATPAR